MSHQDVLSSNITRVEFKAGKSTATQRELVRSNITRVEFKVIKFINKAIVFCVVI